MAIRRCDRFRFDYFLRSCSAENLGAGLAASLVCVDRVCAYIDRLSYPVHLPTTPPHKHIQASAASS